MTELPRGLARFTSFRTTSTAARCRSAILSFEGAPQLWRPCDGAPRASRRLCMSLRAGQGQGAERRLRRADRLRGAPDLRLPVDAQGTGTEGPLFVSLSNKTMGRRLKTRSGKSSSGRRARNFLHSPDESMGGIEAGGAFPSGHAGNRRQGGCDGYRQHGKAEHLIGVQTASPRRRNRPGQQE